MQLIFLYTIRYIKYINYTKKIKLKEINYFKE